jgi:hypothetical protein
VGATAVCKYRDHWKAIRSHLGTGWVGVYNVELWAIGLTLREFVENQNTMQTSSDEGSCLKPLATGHLMNGAPGTWAREDSLQMDKPELEDTVKSWYGIRNPVDPGIHRHSWQ